MNFIPNKVMKNVRKNIMKEVMKLSENEIRTYEKLSGSKFDLSKQPDSKHSNCYYVIEANGTERWRSYKDIINYINFKIEKNIPNKVENKIVKKVPNNFHNKIRKEIHNTFSLSKKDPVERISLGLRASTIKLLKAKAKKTSISYSSIAEQVLHRFLTQEE